MSHQTLTLTEHLYQYILDVSLREPDVLKELRDETAKLPDYFMQISPEQGQFMALLVEILGARKTLELGVYTGYSALVVALALPLDGEIIACENNDKHLAMAKAFWEKAGIINKIKLYFAPALQTLNKLIADGEQSTFDFAFVDADKESYPIYYEKILVLMRRGGLILFDNTLRGGDVADPRNSNKSTKAIRTLNKHLLTDQRISLSLLPIGDGLTIVRKK